MWSKFSYEKHECSFIWKIENFSFILKKDICYVRFSTEGIEHTNWVLCFVKDTEADGSVTCGLKRKSGGPVVVTIAFKVTILSPSGNDLLVADVATFTFEKEGLFRSEKLQEQFESLTNFLWNGALILKCCLKKAVCDDRVSKTCFVRSRNETEKKDYLWSLKRSNFGEMREKICIPLRPAVHGIDELNVKLSYRTGDEFLSIRISLDEYKTKVADVKCKISLLDSKGIVLITLEDKYTFQRHSRSNIWQFPDLIKTQMLNDISSSSVSFHLKFNLSVSSQNGGTSCQRNFYEFPKYQELDSATSFGLGNDLLRLYNDQKFCDVTLKVDDNEFGAHKNILSIRSPVFDSMFQNDMLEKNTGIVKITDVEAEIVNLLLMYVYSGKLDDLDVDSALKLYQAADKYQILTLRDKCSSVLKLTLTVGNVCHVLALADDYRDDNLTACVTDFMSIFGYELFDSEMWRNFMAERTQLTAKIMHQVSLKCLKDL